MANPQRFYRNVGNLDEAKTAIHELTDHTYELREQMSAMKDDHAKAMDGVQKQISSLNSGLNSQVAGISVKSVTDSASLKNGYTIRYNSATGQFEFGV